MEQTTNTQQPTIFLDNIGRTIIGNVTNDADNVLSVENPALVHVQANPQTNQLQLQILPLFFREFLSDKQDSTVWHFRKDSITTCNPLAYSEQFVTQYQNLFRKVEPQASPEVVKLFDEEEEPKS